MSGDWRARFRARYGPWAIVAGGSDGIGAEFARQLAALGLNLVLVGRRSEPLEALAAELAHGPSVETRAVSLDLSDLNQVAVLLEKTTDVEVGLLVCNAAVSAIGGFLRQQAVEHLKTLDLNCRTPLLLAHELAGRMVAAGHGGIILLSSMASFGGTLLSAHYAATKSYARVLAEGLWAELKPNGVDVLAACPGTVRTPTFLRDAPVNSRWSSLPVLECSEVVADSLRSLGHRPVVVPGAVNRIVAFFMQRIFSRKALISLTARATRGMYPHLVERTEDPYRR